MAVVRKIQIHLQFTFVQRPNLEFIIIISYYFGDLSHLNTIHSFWKKLKFRKKLNRDEYNTLPAEIVITFNQENTF